MKQISWWNMILNALVAGAITATACVVIFDQPAGRSVTIAAVVALLLFCLTLLAHQWRTRRATDNPEPGIDLR